MQSQFFDPKIGECYWQKGVMGMTGVTRVTGVTGVTGMTGVTWVQVGEGGYEVTGVTGQG